MKYDELLASGRIRRQKVSKEEIEKAIERAERDIKLSSKLMGEDWEWAFAVAYNAILQASRAYMFSLGYRAAGSEAHKNTFAFISLALGKEFEDLISYFDRMRTKRNKAIYDVAGLITETEARNIHAQAGKFVKQMKALLARKAT
jgi:uncharacterized protein (UPF0332 family)